MKAKMTSNLPALHHATDVPHPAHQVQSAQLEGVCEQRTGAWGAKLVEAAGKHMHMNTNVLNWLKRVI